MGVSTWITHLLQQQYSTNPCRCQILSGSAPVITENNGSDNIAIFTASGGYLFFYWSDSTGTFHKEVVASGVA